MAFKGLRVWVFSVTEEGAGGGNHLIDLYETKERGEKDFMEEYNLLAAKPAGRCQVSEIHRSDYRLSFTYGPDCYHLYRKRVQNDR